MILPSMTYQEMFDHTANDYEKIQIRKEYLLPKAVKEFKKTKHFPAWIWYEYTIPSTNNKYIIFFHSESRVFIEKPVVDFFSIVYDRNKRFIIQWFWGGYKHTENSPLIMIRQIHAYTNHFLTRYNERFLNDNTLNIVDIACRYLSRNKKYMPIEMSDEINKRLAQYGESAKYGFIVRDGFCFTRSALEVIESEDGNRDNDEVKAMLCIYTTFMPDKGLKASQLTAIDSKYETAFMRCLQAFEEEAKDGVITFKVAK